MPVREPTERSYNVCEACEARLIPGEHVTDAEGVDLCYRCAFELTAAEVERLREAATSAVLNALAWMDPDTACRYREDDSYKHLAELLRS
jgi:hypothetical protein